MLKRKITNKLVEWKNNKNKECLLVKGARQVGKTFIIEQFGKQYYSNYIYINFFESPDLIRIFEGNLNADEIYKRMSIYIPNLKLVPNDTLIFLDEIQQCPNARTALKFLALDNKYDVIASGSLLGISYKNISSIPVGYERQITLYSLDFEEFLWAIGMSKDAISYIKSFFDNKETIPEGINDEMLKKLREYLVVGGMPSVVNTFIETRNYNNVQIEQDKIVDLYRDDISRYAEIFEKSKIRQCFNSISRQLAKENTKFKYSEVEKGATKRKYIDSIQWLVDANLITKCFNVSNPILPLNGYEKEDSFKIYLNDIGLLVSMYGFGLKAPLLDNTLKGPAKGGIYENLIADILVKKGYKIHYFKSENNSQEIEFLITQDSNVVPIEVKSGNNKTISLNTFIDKYKPVVAYKLINGNLGVSGNKITLPLYMAMFL